MSMAVQFRLLSGPFCGKVLFIKQHETDTCLNIFIKQFKNRHSLGWNGIGTCVSLTFDKFRL